MRANTNIALKERNALTLKDLRGVDYTSSPLDVSSNRAVEMCNLYCDNGQLRKRHGWDQMHKLSGRINGLWSYKDNTHECLIVHAGTELYRIINGNEKLLMEELTDTRSQAFFNKGKLYIIGVGDYLVYGERNGEYDVKKVSDIAYIPTTAVSINDSTSTDDPRDVLDAVNLLTPKRKNNLLGRSDSGTWYLDDYIDSGSTVTVEIEKSTTYNETVTTIVIQAEGVYSPLDVSELKAVNPNSDKLLPADGEVIGKIYGRGISLNLDTSPPISGRDNITVTFSHTTSGHLDRITNCSIGTLFGVDGNSDRLFLAGSTDDPNTVHFSKDNDFSYFPEINYMTLGSSNAAINGFSRMSDSTLAVIKKPNSSEATMMFISGQYITKSLKTGEEYIDEQFSWKIGAIGEGCVSHHACASFAGDSLILSDNGVFGIVLTDNVSTNERYARERSRLINKRLCTHDLSEAVGISYKNRYYLSVGDEEGSVYVADARYKVSVDDDIDGSYNYEWWEWKGVPARVWAIIDGKLCFGTNDGRICAFHEGYDDRSYLTTDEGEFSLDLSNNGIIHDGSIEVENTTLTIKDRDVIIFNDDLYATITDIFSLHIGMWVIIDGAEHEVTDIDYAEGRFSAKNDAESRDFYLDATSVYINLRGMELYISNATDTSFQLKLYSEGENVLTLCAYNETVPTNIHAKLIYSSPVVAEWYSPPLDFGTAEASKTLLKLTVVSEAVVGGKLSVGYNTRVASKQYNVAGVGKFSLEDLNFCDLTFDTGFATSYSRKVFEKFNFLQFRFRSDNNKDCALNSITALYKINKSNIGVK